MRPMNRAMYRFTPMIIGVVFSIVSSLYSQTSDGQSAGEIHSKSLQIGFINEAALYYQCQINQSLDLRTGISASWNYRENGDGTGGSQSTNSSGTTNQNMTSGQLENLYDIALSSTVMYRLNDYEYATVSIGAGPSISYLYQKYSNSSNQFTDTTYRRSNDESVMKEYGIGPAVSVLIKSHIYGALSVYSEYKFASYYTWHSYDNSTTYSELYSGSTPYRSANHYQTKSNGWKIEFSNIRVGLMIGL